MNIEKINIIKSDEYKKSQNTQKDKKIKTEKDIDIDKKEKKEIEENFFKYSKEDEKDIEKEVEKINEIVEKFNLDRKLNFSVKDDEVIIKVLDKEDNVIRQIPSEQVMEIRARVKKLLGLFIDQEI